MPFEFSPGIVRSGLPVQGLEGQTADRSLMLSPLRGGGRTVIKLGEVVMILDLHRQGLSVSAGARSSRPVRNAHRLKPAARSPPVQAYCDLP